MLGPSDKLWAAKLAKAIPVVSTTEKSGSQGDYAGIKKDTDIRIQSRQWSHVFEWSKWEKSIQKTHSLRHLA